MTDPRLKITDNVITVGAWKFRGKGPFEVVNSPPETRQKKAPMTGEALKKIREKMGLTQSQLADMLCFTDSRHIRALESGEQAINERVQLCLELLVQYGLPKAPRF